MTTMNMAVTRCHRKRKRPPKGEKFQSSPFNFSNTQVKRGKSSLFNLCPHSLSKASQAAYLTTHSSSVA